MKYLQIIMVSLLFISCENNDSSIDNSPIIINEKDCGTFDLTVTDDSTGDYYYITGVRIIPLDKEIIDNKTNYFHCKTLENRIAFEVRTKYIRLDSTEIKNIPNVKSDPIVGEVINPIKYSNASFKLNKDIYYKNTIIPSNTNVLNVATIESGEFYFPLTISPFVWDNINLDKSVFTVPNGNYKVIASWETYDNKTIQDTVDIIVSLKK